MYITEAILKKIIHRFRMLFSILSGLEKLLILIEHSHTINTERNWPAPRRGSGLVRYTYFNQTFIYWKKLAILILIKRSNTERETGLHQGGGLVYANFNRTFTYWKRNWPATRRGSGLVNYTNFNRKFTYWKRNWLALWQECGLLSYIVILIKHSHTEKNF